jgi:hypothetical protein
VGNPCCSPRGHFACCRSFRRSLRYRDRAALLGFLFFIVWVFHENIYQSIQFWPRIAVSNLCGFRLRIENTKKTESFCADWCFGKSIAVTVYSPDLDYLDAAIKSLSGDFWSGNVEVTGDSVRDRGNATIPPVSLDKWRRGFQHLWMRVAEVCLEYLNIYRSGWYVPNIHKAKHEIAGTKVGHWLGGNDVGSLRSMQSIFGDLGRLFGGISSNFSSSGLSVQLAYLLPQLTYRIPNTLVDFIGSGREFLSRFRISPSVIDKGAGFPIVVAGDNELAEVTVRRAILERAVIHPCAGIFSRLSHSQKAFVFRSISSST